MAKRMRIRRWRRLAVTVGDAALRGRLTGETYCVTSEEEVACLHYAE